MRAVIVSNKEWHRRFISEIEARTGVEIIYLSHREDVAKDRLCWDERFVDGGNVSFT